MKSMKLSAIIVTALLLPWSTMAGSAVALQLSVHTNRFDPLRPINAVVTLTNGTDRAIQIGTSGPLLDYQFEILDEQRQSVPKTAQGRWQDQHNRHAGNYAYQLPAGRTETYTLPINWFFDLTKPGRYFVRVSKDVTLIGAPDRPHIHIESDELDITVQGMHLAPFRKLH